MLHHTLSILVLYGKVPAMVDKLQVSTSQYLPAICKTLYCIAELLPIIYQFLVSLSQYHLMDCQNKNCIEDIQKELHVLQFQCCIIICQF
jgi:hypothetical protein